MCNRRTSRNQDALVSPPITAGATRNRHGGGGAHVNRACQSHSCRQANTDAVASHPNPARQPAGRTDPSLAGSVNRSPIGPTSKTGEISQRISTIRMSMTKSSSSRQDVSGRRSVKSRSNKRCHQIFIANRPHFRPNRATAVRNYLSSRVRAENDGLRLRDPPVIMLTVWRRAAM